MKNTLKLAGFIAALSMVVGCDDGTGSGETEVTDLGDAVATSELRADGSVETVLEDVDQVELLALLEYSAVTDVATIEIGDADAVEVPGPWLDDLELVDFNRAAHSMWTATRSGGASDYKICFYAPKSWCYNGYCCAMDGDAIIGRSADGTCDYVDGVSNGENCGVYYDAY